MKLVITALVVLGLSLTSLGFAPAFMKKSGCNSTCACKVCECKTCACVSNAK